MNYPGSTWWTLSSHEERNSIDPEASEQDHQEVEDITGASDDLQEDMVEFLLVAFKKPMSADRRKLVTKCPRPSMA